MTIRKPSAAGTFYPYNSDVLSKDIQRYLDDASNSENRNPAGFIVPHAGYAYSGPVAASAYKSLIGKSISKVVIVAPSHFDGFDGLSIYSGSELETPLGRLNLSIEERDRIAQMDGVICSELGFRQEHSLEVQLPFLQYVLEPGWEVLPFVMGYPHREVIDLTAQLLQSFLNRDTLVIISSDLSHYHSYGEARKMDLKFCQLVESEDLENLWNAHEKHQVEACGFGPVFSFLSAINDKKNISVELLDYRNSGDTSGFKDQVVGYCTIGAFWQD